MVSQDKPASKALAPPLIGFTLLILLMLMLANFGLSQLREIKSHIDAIVLIHNVKSAQIDAMQQANRERVISLQNMFVTDDFFEMDEQAMANMGMANQFITARRQLESMMPAPGEAELLSELREAAIKASPLNDKVRDLLWNEVEGDREEAREILMTGVRPAQDNIYRVFHSLQELYETENQKAVAASASAYEHARSLMFWLMFAAIALSVATAAYVLSRIACHHTELKQHRDRLEELVSERTRALQERSEEAIQARGDAELANMAKSNFLANMSHDLRTPLNAIMGFSETMTISALGPIPPVYGGYAADINKSARHLLDMIEQLLDLSRIEAGKMELSDDVVPLGGLVNEVVRIVASASDRPLEDFLWQGCDPDIAVRADARTLRQTLINIIGNAAKFSKVGTVVKTTCNLKDGDVVLTISDKGIGILPAEIGLIFEPYERSSTEAARSCEGTGLGLPIARSLVEAHGGSLKIASAQGYGTTITLILPGERILPTDCVDEIASRKSA